MHENREINTKSAKGTKTAKGDINFSIWQEIKNGKRHLSRLRTALFTL